MPKASNLLLYLYLIMCACMLLFDLFSVLRRRFSLRAGEARQEQWKRYFNEICARGGNRPDEEEACRYALLRLVPWFLRPAMKGRGDDEVLYFLLRRLNALLEFQGAISWCLDQPSNRYPLIPWVQGKKAVFIRLGERYLNQDSAVRAFYAYLCRRCLLGGPEPEDPITQNMLYLVTDSSLYCRENSLSALYAFGGTEAVAQALVRLARAGVLHSAKLITDGLLSFHGDRRQLSDVLWEHWEEFLPYYQTAIVNYLRMSDSRFCDRLLLLLKEEEEDRELRLAIVRYYRKNRYEPARETLQKLVRSSPTEGWEFAALAALSLESYPGDDTEKVLKQALSHRNWYVRSNAAEALLNLLARPVSELAPDLLPQVSGTARELGDALRERGWYVSLGRPRRAVAPDAPALKDVLEGEDRFARDILRYRLEAFQRE